MFVELNPTPSEEICQSFNELRSDMVLLIELKAALSTCEFELQSLRHQYEALNPGKVGIYYYSKSKPFAVNYFHQKGFFNITKFPDIDYSTATFVFKLGTRWN